MVVHEAAQVQLDLEGSAHSMTSRKRMGLALCSHSQSPLWIQMQRFLDSH